MQCVMLQLAKYAGTAAVVGHETGADSSETRLEASQPDLFSVHDFDVNIDLRLSAGNQYFKSV